MSAVLFLCLSGINDIHKVSSALITSGISLENLQRERNKLLFDRYCRELNEEFEIHAKMENQSRNNHKNIKNDDPDSRRNLLSRVDIEFPDEAGEETETEGFQTARTSNSKLASEQFLNSERSSASSNPSSSSTIKFVSMTTATTRNVSSSDVYQTATEETLVPSDNVIKTDSVPSSPLDDWTLGSENSGNSREVELFVIPTIEEFTGKEESVEEILSTFIEVTDNLPIFIENDIKELEEGEIVTVTGKILKSCETFSINLLQANATRDIALHINPRFPQNYIVRNSRIKDLWGIEEIASPLPFSLERGDPFHIQILVMASGYLISINGRHFAGFSHRIPVKLVNCIEVKGDVEEIEVDRHMTNCYPEDIEGSEPIPIQYKPYQRVESQYLAEKMKNPENIINPPYYGKLTEEFTKGKRIQILGKIKMLPHSFYINLQSGHKIWPHPEIAFHFNPRFAKANVGKHIICKNAWYNGKWDKEERTEIAADFCPGKPFSLEIVCHQQTYEVILNSKVIAEFYFRVEPTKVDTIYIQGDIKIWDIVLSTIRLVKD